MQDPPLHVVGAAILVALPSAPREARALSNILQSCRPSCATGCNSHGYVVFSLGACTWGASTSGTMRASQLPTFTLFRLPPRVLLDWLAHGRLLETGMSILLFCLTLAVSTSLVGCWWLLREIEAALAFCQDVTDVDPATVQVYLSASKTDPPAKGVHRALPCVYCTRT